jgi:RNA polymerase sigma-70 factor (ECF subfamily)
MPATDAACGVEQAAPSESRRSPADRALEDLLRRCAGKDRAAWDGFVMRFKDEAYGLAFRFVGNAQDAEDVTIEAFLRLWQTPWWSARPRVIKAWLAKVIHNLCADLLRDAARQRERRLCDVALQQRAQAGTLLPADTLHMALSRLNPQQRRAVVLCLIHGLGSDDAALVMGRSAGTIRRWLSEARVVLRRELCEVSEAGGEMQ